MEGTSGVAERTALRGAAREAALKGARRVSGVRPGRLVKEGIGNEALARRETPAFSATSLRQEVSGSIGLGQSSHCERSQREAHEAIRGYAHPGFGPLTRELSTGRAPATCDRKVNRRSGTSVATREKSCAGGRLPVRCAGFERSVGRARRSIRLQKSTSGARPFTPAGEESADHEIGLATRCESIAGGEKAPEAGSWWQSRGTGGGLPT